MPGAKPKTGQTIATKNAWKVMASQESDGGDGSCGPIGSGGMWYSELSTVPMGTASDFHALGGLPCGTVLNIQNPADGTTVQASKRDVGAGSGFLPVMGIYPATAAALHLSGGQYVVIIWRADGQPMHPVRGTPTSGSGGVSGIARPGGSSSSGAAIDALFAAYDDEVNMPRKAPKDNQSALKWWLKNFGGRYGKE